MSADETCVPCVSLSSLGSNKRRSKASGLRERGVRARISNALAKAEAKAFLRQLYKGKWRRPREKVMKGRKFHNCGTWTRMQKALKKYRGEKCEQCGSTLEELKIRFPHCRNQLQVHHKMPRRFYPHQAFDITNLIILCQPCHVVVEREAALASLTISEGSPASA